MAALGRVEIERRGGPALRLEDRPQQERPVTHAHARCLRQRSDAHRAHVGIGRAEVEPEIERCGHALSLTAMRPTRKGAGPQRAIPPQRCPARSGLRRRELGQCAGRRDELARHHDDRHGVLLRADFGDHLHSPQFEPRRALHDRLRRLAQKIGGIEFGLSLDLPRPLLPQCLGLLRHRPLHALGDLDVLHLDALHLDAPRFGHVVDLLLDRGSHRFLLLQHLVERMMADARAQVRERDLDHGMVDALHVDDRAARVDDAIPHHCVDLDRDVVLGDRLLLLDRRGVDTQVDGRLPLDHRDDPVEAGAARVLIASEAEDDGALVLVGDTQTRQSDQHQGCDDEDYDRHGSAPWLLRGIRTAAWRQRFPQVVRGKCLRSTKC